MEQMTQVNHSNPLATQPIGKLLMKFAIPSVISMLVNAIYNIVDQIFIGQGVGYLGNAATTIAFPVVSIILSIGTLLGAGGSAYASIKLGEKKEEEAEKTLGTVFTLLIISGIILTIVGFLFITPMLKLFGASDQTMDYAMTYTSILLGGTVFNLLGIGLSNLARTDGSPEFSMYSILIGAVLNLILDPIYIFVFQWGVAGASVATVTSQIISAILLIWYFLKKGKMRLRKRNLKLDLGICRNLLALGLSSFILQIANTIMQIVMNNSLFFYGNKTDITGDVALSAMGVVLKINMILISICVGISIGSQPILGFNRGAEKPLRIRHTYCLAVISASAVAIIGWLGCILIPGAILSIFGTKDAKFTEFGIQCMKIFLSGVFVVGFQIVSTGYFQATGQSIKATILSSLRQVFLLIPLVLILPKFYGLNGILYSGFIADLGAAFLTLCFVIHEMRSLNQWIRKEKKEEQIFLKEKEIE